MRRDGLPPGFKSHIDRDKRPIDAPERAGDDDASRKTPIAGMGDEPAHDLRAFLDRADPTRASVMPGGHVGPE